MTYLQVDHRARLHRKLLKLVTADVQDLKRGHDSKLRVPLSTITTLAKLAHALRREMRQDCCSEGSNIE
jgi:hypothetical protein